MKEKYNKTKINAYHKEEKPESHLKEATRKKHRYIKKNPEEDARIFKARYPEFFEIEMTYISQQFLEKIKTDKLYLYLC